MRSVDNQHQSPTLGATPTAETKNLLNFDFQKLTPATKRLYRAPPAWSFPIFVFLPGLVIWVATTVIAADGFSVQERGQTPDTAFYSLMRVYNGPFRSWGQLLAVPVFACRAAATLRAPWRSTARPLLVALVCHLVNTAIRAVIYVSVQDCGPSCDFADHIFLAISLSVILQYEIGVQIQSLARGDPSDGLRWAIAVFGVALGVTLFILNIGNGYVTSRYYHTWEETMRSLVSGEALFTALGVLTWWAVRRSETLAVRWKHCALERKTSALESTPLREATRGEPTQLFCDVELGDLGVSDLEATPRSRICSRHGILRVGV